MRKFVRSTAAGAALCAMATNALAAQAPCARPQELEALKTSAVTQELMVAALSCEAIDRYNQFITFYQPELQASDRQLQNFFRRLNPRTGTADYHAYKTRMANAASRRSIAHITNFCNGAEVIFQTALDGGPLTLVSFLQTQPVFDNSDYSVCEGVPIIAYEDATPPEIAAIPRMKPSLVLPVAMTFTLRTSLAFPALGE